MTPTMNLEVQPMLIGTEWLSSSEQFDVKLPFDGTMVARVAAAGEALLERAISAAQSGAKAMAALTNAERADLLMRIHDLVKRDLPEYARIVCQETGKPLREARVEAERALQTLLWSSIEARQLHGEVVPLDGAPGVKGRYAMTVREPVGVVGAITPFNLPLNLALHKIGPALAAGNAVIHKPAEKTPLSALRLARTLQEAGAPAGAYNVVNGPGAVLGPLMAASEGVNMLTFTGSVPVGKALQAAAGFKPVSLELGNNSAVIVEPDCDLEAAVSRCVTGGYAHSGQICISVQRIYIHESVYDDFLSGFKRGVEALKIGHPMEETTEVSSLISEAAATRVVEWIGEALVGGAKLITGGGRRFSTVQPTILANVPPAAKISCEEVFGPVVMVYPYRELGQAILAVNDTPFGLQAGIYTRDLAKAFTAARKLKVGGVMINDVPMFRADHMPYGGVKDSGNTREGPRYAIEAMSSLKLIVWKT